MERTNPHGLFGEENLIDDASMKLGVAKAILAALHLQHSDLKQRPELEQEQVSTLIYSALELVEAANASVQAIPVAAGKRIAA